MDSLYKFRHDVHCERLFMNDTTEAQQAAEWTFDHELFWETNVVSKKPYNDRGDT